MLRAFLAVILSAPFAFAQPAVRPVGTDVLHALENPDPALRSLVPFAAQELRGEDQRTFLQGAGQLANDPTRSMDVRIAAARALAVRGHPMMFSAPALKQLLNTRLASEVPVQTAALAALIENQSLAFAEKSTDVLALEREITLLFEDSTIPKGTRVAAGKVLAKGNPYASNGEHQKAWRDVALRRTEESEIRALAFEALGNVRGLDDESRRGIEVTLADHNEGDEIRLAVAHALFDKTLGSDKTRMSVNVAKTLEHVVHDPLESDRLRARSLWVLASGRLSQVQDEAPVIASDRSYPARVRIAALDAMRMGRSPGVHRRRFLDAALSIVAAEPHDSDLYRTARMRVVDLSENAATEDDLDVLPLVERGVDLLKPGAWEPQAQALKQLRTARKAALLYPVRAYVLQHPLLPAMASYLLLVLLANLAMVRLRPLWVLRLDRALASVTDIKLPEWAGGLVVSPRWLLGISWFRHSPRVLNAWVISQLQMARSRFEDLASVKARRLFVPLSVLVDGESMILSAAHGAKLLTGVGRTLLIVGEGGTGKSTLAFGIARELMSSASTSVALPVLLSPSNAGVELMSAVAQQLQRLTGASESIDTALVKKLIASGRIVLLIDGWSELTAELRKASLSALSHAPACRAVVTGRHLDDWEQPGTQTVRMTPISAVDLVTFLTAYLGNADLDRSVSPDEILEAGLGLTRLTAGRPGTVLLAKLYADGIIAQRAGSAEELADSVPALVMRYLYVLCEGNPLPSDEVLRYAGAFAWASIENTLLPTSISLERLKKHLGHDAQSAVQQLEQLHLIEPSGELAGTWRFTLDPVAEYLAAYYALTALNGDAGALSALCARLCAARAKDASSEGLRAALLDWCNNSTVASVEARERVTAELCRESPDEISALHVAADQDRRAPSGSVL
jgi:hypothetical protein